MPVRPIVLTSLLFAAVLGLACGDDGPTAPSPTPTTAQPPGPPPGPPPPGPAPQAVTHSLTMTASPSCTALPEVAKTRTYPAQVIEKSNGDILVWVVNSYDIMVGWANDNGFTGIRDGNSVRFDITDDIFNAAYAMVERIPEVGDMGYGGTATGTIDSNRKIVATFNGQYRFAYGGRVLCEALDHHIEVTPIG